MRIEGLDKLRAKLKKLSDDAKKVSVVVGYTQAYAIFVHENLEALHGAAYNAAYINTTTVMVTKGKNAGQMRLRHEWTAEAVKRGYNINASGNLKKAVPKAPEQQAKFLEQPARMFAGQIREIVAAAMRKGRMVGEALLLGGLFLQRKSQEIVPIDTGALRASAFTRRE